MTLEHAVAELVAAAAATLALWRTSTRKARQRVESLEAELVAVHAALREAKVKADAPQVLAGIADKAVAYAEQMGGKSADKLAHALAAARRLDNDDNGVRDFTDAQLRIAIEAALQRMKHNREKA